MAHKTLIDGTAYAVKGGRDLIGGTGYDKKQGKALVDGTARTITFAPTEYVLTISDGSTSQTGAYVEYGEMKHASGTLHIPVGGKVRVIVGYSRMNAAEVTLTGAGTLKGLGSSGAAKRYEYTPASNATIKFSRKNPSPQNPGIYYWVGTITEE